MFIFLWWWWTWLSWLANIFFDIWIKNIKILDSNKSQITDKLSSKWIEVIIWDWIYNFNKDDIIIYSDAVVNSIDFSKIENQKKMTYFEFLWELSKWFKTISIAGTHGKTSTTWMALYLSKKINFEELWIWILGWLLPDLWWSNYFINQNHKEDIRKIIESIFLSKWKQKPIEKFKKLYFILEADEFNRHFLLLDSYISLITCIDHDHQEVYRTKEEYDDAFKIFKNKTNLKFIDSSKLKSQKIEFNHIFWEYMQENAWLVVELFESLGYERNYIVNNLKNFKWIWRRQEYIWNLWKLKIYSDYAHHPTEINATIDAFSQKFKNENIIWIFQAHQIYRLKNYESDFIDSLKKFKEIIIYDIYSAREEKYLKKGWWKNLEIDEIKKIIWEDIAKKTNWIYIESFEGLVNEMQGKEWVAVLLTAWDLDYKFREFIN